MLALPRESSSFTKVRSMFGLSYKASVDGSRRDPSKLTSLHGVLELEESFHDMPIDVENTEEYEEHKAHEDEEEGQVPVHVVGKVDVDNVNGDHGE